MNRLIAWKDNLVRYFREVRSEMKKIIWPTRKETIQYTLVVVGSVFLLSIFLWIVDSIFSNLLHLIIS